jgi:hypothetical protein
LGYTILADGFTLTIFEDVVVAAPNAAPNTLPFVTGLDNVTANEPPTMTGSLSATRVT